MLSKKNILVTGGTGSFGRAFIRTVLERHPDVGRVVVLSLRFFIGDVRDRERLRRASTASTSSCTPRRTKQVPAAEYNPFECVKTNVLGAQNLIEACIDKGVQRVVALSTDKASQPDQPVRRHQAVQRQAVRRRQFLRRRHARHCAFRSCATAT
jgi:UDP-N-acetylglucosamine 4,6-dehydratase